MNHFLAYHNPEKNPAPARIEVPGRYTCRRRVRSMRPGDNIWLLTREDGEYLIHQVYELGEIRRLAGGAYCYRGRGVPRAVGVKIRNLPLYQRLRRETANFCNLAARLSGKTVRLLEAL